LQLITKWVAEQLSDILSAEVSAGLRKKNKRNFLALRHRPIKTNVFVSSAKSTIETLKKGENFILRLY